MASSKDTGNEKNKNSPEYPGSHTYFNEGEWALHWNYRTPLVGYSVLWCELIFTFGIPFVIIAGLGTFFSHTDSRVTILIVFIVLFALILLIAFALLSSLSRSLGGGIDASYFLNPSGIGYEASEAALRIHRSTQILSLISGLVGAAGTSLIALSQEKNFIQWTDVKRVRIHSHPRIVYIGGKENGIPIALYCPPEIFEQVTGTVSKNTPYMVTRS